MISACEAPLAPVNQAYVQHLSPGSDVVTEGLLFSTGESEDLVPEGEEMKSATSTLAVSRHELWLCWTPGVPLGVSLVQDGVAGKGQQVAQEGCLHLSSATNLQGSEQISVTRQSHVR